MRIKLIQVKFPLNYWAEREVQTADSAKTLSMINALHQIYDPWVNGGEPGPQAIFHEGQLGESDKGYWTVRCPESMVIDTDLLPPDFGPYTVLSSKPRRLRRKGTQEMGDGEKKSEPEPDFQVGDWVRVREYSGRWQVQATSLASGSRLYHLHNPLESQAMTARVQQLTKEESK